MSFEKDMRRFEQRVATASADAIRAASQEIYADIVMATPVGYIDNWKSVKEWRAIPGNSGRPPWLKGYVGGTARGNWQAQVGRHPSGTIDDPDPSGRETIAAANLAAARFTLADTLYFANNLPYAQRLEDGWSTQAPTGMVANAVTGFRRAVEAGARKHRI